MTDATKILALAKSAEESSKWQRTYLHSQHEQTKQDKEANKTRIYCSNCGKKHMGGGKSCRNPRGQDDRKRKLEPAPRDHRDRRDQPDQRGQRDQRDQRGQRDRRDQGRQRDDRWGGSQARKGPREPDRRIKK